MMCLDRKSNNVDRSYKENSEMAMDKTVIKRLPMFVRLTNSEPI